MKRLIVIALLSLSCIAASAARPMLRWGAEWGYGATFFHYRNLNYMDPEVGYRVWDEGHDFSPSANAWASVFIGADLLPWMNVSAGTGFMGISKDRRVIPVFIKTEFYPRGSSSDGPLVRLAGGLGFPGLLSSPPVRFVSAGGGWRLALDRISDLDFFADIRFCGDNPPVTDDDGTVINESNIRRNTAIYCSLEFGVALSF